MLLDLDLDLDLSLGLGLVYEKLSLLMILLVHIPDSVVDTGMFHRSDFDACCYNLII